MKFDFLNTLKDRKYIVTCKRVYLDTDADNVKEDELIDNFGYPSINTTGKFEGFITKDGDNYAISLEGNTSSPNVKSFKFAISPAETNVLLTKTVSFNFVVNLDNEIPFVFDTELGTEIPANKVAELKVELYKLVIKKRIEESLTEWKALDSKFEENRPVDSYTFNLTEE